MPSTNLRVVLFLVLTLGLVAAACQSETKADKAEESGEKSPDKDKTPEKAETGENNNDNAASDDNSVDNSSADESTEPNEIVDGPTPADTVNVTVEVFGGHTAQVAFAKPEGWQRSDRFEGSDVYVPDVQKNEMLWARFDFTYECLGDCSKLEENVAEQMAKLKGELNPAEHSYDIIEGAFPDLGVPAIAVGHRYPPEMEKKGFSSQLRVRCFFVLDEGVVVGSGSAPLDHQAHYLPAMVEMCQSAVVTAEK